MREPTLLGTATAGVLALAVLSGHFPAVEITLTVLLLAGFAVGAGLAVTAWHHRPE